MTTSFSSADTTRASTSASSTSAWTREISMGDFVVTGGEIPRWRSRTPCAAWCRAYCRTRSASRRNRTGTVFWSIPSIPAPTNGTDAACRTCCSPATTATWEVAAQAELYPHDAAPPPDLWAQFDERVQNKGRAPGCSPRPRPMRGGWGGGEGLPLGLIPDRRRALLLGAGRRFLFSFSGGGAQFHF